MKQMGTDYRKIITIEADKMGGKPCVRGLGLQSLMSWTILPPA